MAKTITASVERLHELFSYDPETGHLRWKKRDRKLTGKIAGGVDPGHGYRRVRVDGRLFLVHRVIIAMTQGQWPADEVDHINGDRDDNRLINLRCVPKASNLRNKCRYRSNNSGRIGVYWHSQHRKWCAAISVNGKTETLGIFFTKQAAIAARDAAEKKHGYHPNRGS